MKLQNLETIFCGNRIDRLKNDLYEFPIYFFIKNQQIFLKFQNIINPIKIYQDNNNFINLEFYRNKSGHYKMIFCTYNQALQCIIDIIKNPNKYIDMIW